ncbi:Similar to hypothetical protein CHGG_08881 [Chaetomium globosum CBS 148.51]; acc. no. XP_001226808 [Pyronema omphalodes CBS 100304]|uniref:Uncharacterized protein n=1 Tax=Pyronema omphalodes (strain CBS 100304) TaxID=1076935 RepID=U4L9H2_PYROM|nr:Similar to hypothetical protein CHGG_08881 [Chaetomium globosum CBS 148.51]; acc. no. XP_001226808 [Pyronema omphalodes CBS 100304]
MSQSMGWIEDLIFVVAPLGIITAITGAIRVGGPSYLKAIIGRAREGKGAIELELMSSTSTDICELWNGNGVSWVQGSVRPAPIMEVFYLKRTKERKLTVSENYDDHRSVDTGLLQRNSWKSHSTEIYDFESGGKAGVLGVIKNKGSDQAELDGDTAQSCPPPPPPPTLGLNIGQQRVPELELRVIAVFGVLLQTGVLVFAGITVAPPWKAQFMKSDKAAPLYAFPYMVAGTIAMVLGLFICARIIERSTDEKTWTRENQANDQQFDSYFIQRASKETHKMDWFWTGLSVFLGDPSVARNREIRTTRSEKATSLNVDQNTLTIIAVSICLFGFIAQFVGLRGLKWSVTIAQLMATAIMTLLRVVFRRDLVLDEVQREELPKGYELDWSAKRLTDCATWRMIISFHLKGTPRVIDARCRLGDLSGWEGHWKVKVNPIVATMNFLCTCDNVDIANLSTENVFSWQLVVEVAEVEINATSLDSATREDEDTTAENTTQGNRRQQKLETVELGISWKRLSEGRGWGSWQMDDFNKAKIEAILG